MDSVGANICDSFTTRSIDDLIRELGSAGEQLSLDEREDDALRIDEALYDDSNFDSMTSRSQEETRTIELDMLLESSIDDDLNTTMNSFSSSSLNVRKPQRPIKRPDKILREELKFMNDFDPSKRMEQKKKKRYITDSLGRPQLLAHNFDSCDCLIPDCTGCHFPCRKCGDTRCGHECRQNRRWLYESIEIEGREGGSKERKNPNLPPPLE